MTFFIFICPCLDSCHPGALYNIKAYFHGAGKGHDVDARVFYKPGASNFCAGAGEELEHTIREPRLFKGRKYVECCKRRQNLRALVLPNVPRNERGSGHAGILMASGKFHGEITAATPRGM